jgi:hypothetical protein
VSGDLAEWLVPALHSHPSPKNPRVFSADLTPLLVTLMREPDSALEAVCGVDLYSYGRLIMQAAADRSGQPPIAVPPVLVTRQEVIGQGIHNYVQLLETYPGLEMGQASGTRLGG